MVDHAPCQAKHFVTRMLTRDLPIAVANLLVYTVYAEIHGPSAE